jgi:chromosome segregation ATPase
MALAKLKSVTVDKIVIPDTQTLYARRSSEIAEAKAALAKLVAQIVAAEKLPNSQRRGYSELLAKRASLRGKIERLSREAGLLKAEIVASKPQPPLNQWQQLFADAAKHDPYGHIERGTPEQIAAAQAELDQLVDQYRRNPPGGDSRDAWVAKKNAVRTKLEALKGPPYPAHRPWASDETLKAERAKQGLK